MAVGLIQRVRLRFAAAAATVGAASGRLAPRDRDAALAIGELASSEVVAAVLTTAGVPARWIDARQVIVTDERFGCAAPDPAAIRQAAACAVTPSLDAGEVPVLGGFIGASVSGLTTTLGRGGSDYSAALLGAALDAAEIQIWTDVDGVLTADPRSVPHPRLIRELSFAEAYELARFGAKVLHWGTLEPAAANSIPVRVLNARTPDVRGGTTITASRSVAAGVIGLAHQPHLAVADIRARGVTGTRAFIHEALEWLDRAGHGVTVVSLSPTRLVATAPEVALLRDLEVALHASATSSTLTGRAAVTIVGTHASTHPEVWHAVRQETARIELAIPAHSGHALVCLTGAGQGPNLLTNLHARFFGRATAGPRKAALPLPAGAAVGAQSLSGVTQ
jgi:aspartate kinase